MPVLGYDMEAGTVREWLKAIDDRVTRGEAIAIIETDKAEVEMEALHSGRLVEIIAELGTAISVGDVIAYLETE
jgi:pyruvate dehydrogenase E2 component (dihydrolipoamide acetyltransferase)